MARLIHCVTLAVCLAMWLAPRVSADAVTFMFEWDEWQSSVGEFTTIDFTDYPGNTPLSNQYQHIGITFSGATFFDESSAYYDGHGMVGVDNGAWAHFDSPQHWIAFHKPGILQIDLHYKGDLIYTSPSTLAPFVGFVSSIPFDTVYMYKPEPNVNHVFIDDIHFGAIPAPGALGLLGLAALLGSGSSRRRRRRARSRTARAV